MVDHCVVAPKDWLMLKKILFSFKSGLHELDFRMAHIMKGNIYSLL